MAGRRMIRTVIGTLFVTGLLFSGNATAAVNAHVYVNIRPPAPIVETRVAAPGPGFVWVSGYYRHDGRAYVWVPGSWERPPHARAAWVRPRWAHDRHGYYMVEGHWR